MSAERKKNVNIEELAKLIAVICYIIAGIVFVASVFMLTGKTAAAGIVFALVFPVVIYTLVKAQKFDRNSFNSEGKMKTGSKALVGAIIAGFVFVAIGVGALLNFSSKPAEYTLKNGILSISGMYGQEVAMIEINSLELEDKMPEVLARTNGSALGTALKGNFKLKDIGAAKLFIDKSKPPFIHVKTKSAIIILNCEESEKTKALYEKLKRLVC
jgi:hypothetical protein